MQLTAAIWTGQAALRGTNRKKKQSQHYVVAIRKIFQL